MSGFIPLAQRSEAGVSTSFFSVAEANVLLSDGVNLQARHGPPPPSSEREQHTEPSRNPVKPSLF